MDKVFNLEIDGQITLPDGSKLGPLYETTVNVVQPSEGATDPILENAKESGGIGYFEYYTDNSTEARLSMVDKSLNTKYLVLDLSEESQTKMDMIRSVIKLSNVNKRSLQWKLKAYLNTTSMGKLETVFNTTNCTAYDDSGKNYYENSNNNKFYVILDNSLLGDELREVFPKNGIYFECSNPAAMSQLSEVSCSIRKYNTISQDYIGAPLAIYLSTTGGKVMAIRVANDGTITASEA